MAIDPILRPRVTGRRLTRIVAVVVFGLLTIAAVSHIGYGDPSGIAIVARSAYAAVLVLQVAAFASQPAPRTQDGRAGVWTVTLMATFGMVVAPSLPRVRTLWTISPTDIRTQAVLGLIGMGVALWAMASLRRSFSLTPQARRLASTGPYRFMRHPLYLGEALNIVGIAVGVGSLTVVVAAIVVVICEVARASLEEGFLRGTFPDYDNVFAGVAHIFPGIW